MPRIGQNHKHIMNKVSFNQSPAFLEKVKKDVSAKGNKPSRNERVQEHRHEKINFKQYLRGIQEEQAKVVDEFMDVELLQPNQAFIRDNRDAYDFLDEKHRVINFGGAYETEIAITEGDWDEICGLDRDESMTVSNLHGELWYVTRSLTNHLVFESSDSEYSGKFEFDSVIKRLA